MLKARIERLEAQAAKKGAEVDIVAILNDGRERGRLGLPWPAASPVDEPTQRGRELAAARRRVGLHHHHPKKEPN